jgi:Family of unknown function (DUF6318)
MRTKSVHSQSNPEVDRRHQRRRSLGAGGLCLILAAGFALAGCASTDLPLDETKATQAHPSLSTTTPATTHAPTPTPKPVYKPATASGPAQNVPVPVLPAKAKEFSKAGLEEFARYWYSTLGYVFETGDSTPMMAVTDAACMTCANTNGPVSEWYKAGGWITGGKMTIYSSTSSFEDASDSTYQAILMIQQSPVSYYKPNGSLDESLPPTDARADIVVARYVGGHWVAKTAEHLTRN